MAEMETNIQSNIKGFNEHHKASIVEGVLATKTKEQIALGITISLRCGVWFAFYLKDALSSGANSKEIMRTRGGRSNDGSRNNCCLLL